MSEQALKGLVRVIDKQGTVWWTRPENVASFLAIERTNVSRPGRIPMVNGEFTDYDEMYWAVEKKKLKKEKRDGTSNRQE